MKKSFFSSRPVTALLAAMLCVYLAAVALVNFSGVPGFYDSDMYTDIRYAVECWDHKSIFPEGWVFGNQLYAVSTPVLAALCYGLLGNPGLAMALASTIMAAGVIGSFEWMMKSVIRDKNARLLGCVLLLGMPLLFGDAWKSVNGWQLLYTMCAYYACYAIAAFLAYGCYLRSMGEGAGRFWLAAACVMAFGTGIQSLRQTAVMTLPLLGMEMLRLGYLAVRKEKIAKAPLVTAALISGANLAGLVCARVAELEQVQIIGQLGIHSISGMITAVPGSILTMLRLVLDNGLPERLALLLLALASAAALGGIVYRAVTQREGKTLALLILLSFSVLAIWAVDILTTMEVRSIYYFMLYPLLSFLAAWLYGRGGKGLRGLLTVFVLAVFLFSCAGQLLPVYAAAESREEDPAYEISEYLKENGYTMVYSSWNQGADIPAASGWQVEAAFWEYAEEPFFYYNYLCNPEVFRADNDRCVYLLRGEAQVKVTVAKAEEMGISMEELAYFPESDTWLYAASENILEKLQ